jgi:hypothetical protein
MTNEDLKEELAAGEAVIAAHREAGAVIDHALIGSALYLPADVVGDVDFAILLAEGSNAMDWTIGWTQAEPEWQACGEYDTSLGEWCAVRRGNPNIMHSRAFFDGYKLAMEVCKVLRLERKEDRVAVCKVVRDGLPADEVRPW